jgi:hypothetical protein
MPANPLLQTRIIDYILVGGMIPAAAAGYYLITQRYYVFQGTLYLLILFVNTISGGNGSSARNRRKF